VSVYGDFGSFTIGRLTLREALSAASETSGTSGRQLKLTGQEAVPILTSAQLAAIQDDLPGMVGSFVPVYFDNKSDRNGYWMLTDAQCDLMNWNDELVTCTWSMTLDRMGSDTEIDLESRLTGTLTRDNDWGATGERVHIPPIGHYGYYSGSTQPGVIVRTGSDGAMLVYRTVPTNVNPRWGCSVQTYMMGRVRFLDAHNIERGGTAFSVRPLVPPLTPDTDLVPNTNLVLSSGAALNWTLTNSLVQVTPAASGGLIDVAAYTGGTWQTKRWDVLIGGTSMGAADTVTVLRNEPEIVVVRLLRSGTPGRITVDLTLRRGHRVVELYVQNTYSTTVKLALSTPEAGTLAATPGALRASVNDGAGNRYVVGSASTFTADIANGAVSASSVVAFDAFIGVEVGGLSALPGDTALDLFAAYLGAPAETVQAVRR
jgi:hypothetical protein